MENFGQWVIRPTSIVRQDHKERFRICLLFPPPGFSGRARLGVIDATRREEFTATWIDGRNQAIPADDPALVDQLFARLQTDRPLPGWPLGFRLRLDPPQADILLEVDVHSSDPSTGESRSAHITCPTLPDPGVIYFCPLLPPSGDSALLRAALKATERDQSVRFGLMPGWSIAGLEDRVRRLEAEGRLDRLLASGGRIGLLPAGDLPPPRNSEWQAVLWRGGSDPPQRLAGRIARESKDLLLHHGGLSPGFNPLRKAHELLAVALLDRVPTWNSTIGLCTVELRDPDDWGSLAKDARRWMRSHSAPQLRVATLSDFFAGLEELRAEGRIQVPSIGAPAEDR